MHNSPSALLGKGWIFLFCSISVVYFIQIWYNNLDLIHTIVEIKSTRTYDKQNMIDKSAQYKKLGYNFKLILDHKEYDYCP